MSIFNLSFLNIDDVNITYHRITTKNDNNMTGFSTMTALTTIAFVSGPFLGVKSPTQSKRYPAKPIDGRSTPGLFLKK